MTFSHQFEAFVAHFVDGHRGIEINNVVDWIISVTTRAAMGAMCAIVTSGL
jgi:hypothetical protein